MLKRYFFISAVLIIFSACMAVHAQEGLTVGWKLGGNLAWNFSNSIKTAFDSDAEMIEKQFGWSLGVFAVKPWLGADGIQAELLISRHATKSVSSEKHYQTWKLTYVSVPVLYQKNLRVRENGCRSYVFAGLVPGILVDSQYIYQVGGLEEKSEIEDTNPIDFGIALGLGRISSEGISLDLRYQIGLLNVAEGDAKNDVLSLYLGFVIR